MKITTLAITMMMATLTMPGKIRAMIKHTQDNKTASPTIGGIETGALELQLLSAIKRQQVAIVRKLLANGADPHVQNADNETTLHIAAAGDSNEIIHCIINCVLFKTSDAKKQASRERLLTALCCIRRSLGHLPQELLCKIIGKSDRSLKDLWQLHGLNIGRVGSLHVRALMKAQAGNIQQRCIEKLTKLFSHLDTFNRTPSKVPEWGFGRNFFPNRTICLDPTRIETNWGNALENHIRTHLELTASEIDRQEAVGQPEAWCNDLSWVETRASNDPWESDVRETSWW